MARNYAWCYTLNNYSDTEYGKLVAVDCQYHVFGKEIAPKTGTPHIQGYIYMYEKQSLRSMRRKVSLRARFTKALGSAEQNFKYCSKTKDYKELGVRPMSQKEKGQTEKDKWAKIIALAKDQKLDEICVEYPSIYLRMYSTLKRIARDHQKKPETLTELINVWLFGATGLGKTVKALKMAGTKDSYYIKNANKWFCNYQGEHTVIIDDIGPKHHCLAYYLKIWGDFNPFQAESKGSSSMIRPKRIIITSNYSIKDIFPEEENYGPLERRYEQVHYVRPLGKSRKRKRDPIKQVVVQWEK